MIDSFFFGPIFPNITLSPAFPISIASFEFKTTTLIPPVSKLIFFTLSLIISSLFMFDKDIITFLVFNIYV